MKDEGGRRKTHVLTLILTFETPDEPERPQTGIGSNDLQRKSLRAHPKIINPFILHPLSLILDLGVAIP